MSRTLIAARLCLALCAIAPSALAQSFEAHGVIVRRNLFCFAFETDDGLMLGLENLGSFTEGERVFVSGTVGGPALCGGAFILTQIAGNSIEPAFAGVGRVEYRDGTPMLDTPDGASYVLGQGTDFPRGTRVFVKGAVSEVVTKQGSDFVIDNQTMGVGFESFGRLSFQDPDWFVRAEQGNFRLEQLSIRDGEEGDYVYVQGWQAQRERRPLATLTPGGLVLRGSSVAVPRQTDYFSGDDATPLLRDNTVRPAYELSGVIVDDPTLGIAFKADGVIFNDIFLLEDYGGFALGQRAFVRGRKLTDFHPLEQRVVPLIRQSRIDTELAECGLLVEDAEGAFTFMGNSGSVVELEFSDDFSDGEFVYVAGVVDDPLLPTVLEHNTIAFCREFSGALFHGFECTPLFVLDIPDPIFSGSFLLENLGPYWIGDSFCVLGAITACEDFCPTACIVANTVHDCTQ